MPDLLRRLFVLLVLGALAVGAAPLRADEPPEAEEEEEEVGAGADLGDQTVPFGEQVNRAIEEGTRWLRARGKPFSIPGTDGVEGAFWGHIKGKHLYGGGEGRGYPHPAGPTALALYTLLKCGVPPKDPAIQKGFAWLRELHLLTDEWDGMDMSGRTRRATHTLTCSSYELSAMILALTARYDPYKKSSQTEVVRRRGKLKIKNRADRVWLQQLVTALIGRRGQPTGQATRLDPSTVQRFANPDKEMDPPQAEGPLPMPEERLGWRYNIPHIDLVHVRKSGRSTSTESFRLGGGPLPPNANQDLSSTQLAALALFAAHQFRVDVPLDVWMDIVDFTLSHQEEEGPEHARHDPMRSGGGAAPKDHARGFVYIKGSPDHSEGIATGSMTACGVANLLMARQVITDSAKGKKIWSERALDRKVDTAIWDGLAWLDEHWSSFRNPSSQTGYHLYYLYSIERAQDLRRKELIGKHLWYKEGATEILGRQIRATLEDPFARKGGEVEGVHWNTDSTHDPKDVLDTCFALLFLKRATRGIAPTITHGD